MAQLLLWEPLSSQGDYAAVGDGLLPRTHLVLVILIA